MKIGIIQQSNCDNVEQNKQKLADNIRKVAAEGAELIVLQELHNSLYFCQIESTQNFSLAEPIPGPSTVFYSAIAAECKVVLVTSLFEARAKGLYHNTAVVFDKDGSMAGKYRKMHIPDDPAYYEKFYFTPGDIGFRPIRTSIGTLGVQVCWDQWYPEGARLMALRGADLLIYPTAIGWESSDTKEEQERQLGAWQTVQRGHGVANGCYICAVNRCGVEGETTFWGQSFVSDYCGQIVAKAPVKERTILYADIDLAALEAHRRIWPFFRDRRIDSYSGITRRWGK